jgi:hypothetical protein
MHPKHPIRRWNWIRNTTTSSLGSVPILLQFHCHCCETICGLRTDKMQQILAFSESWENLKRKRCESGSKD